MCSSPKLGTSGGSSVIAGKISPFPTIVQLLMVNNCPAITRRKAFVLALPGHC